MEIVSYLANMNYDQFFIFVLPLGFLSCKLGKFLQFKKCCLDVSVPGFGV